MSEITPNPFKSGIAKGQPQVGLWSTLSSPTSAEVIAGAGYDWLLFDSEHSPVDTPGLIEILRAANGCNHAAVRVPWNDAVMIKKALDIGAQTLFVPFVQTPQEAEQAVQSCRYPQAGIRGVAGSTRASGYGRTKDYLHKASDEICVILQVETREALEQIEEIATVPGVDGIFIGPSDLSASYGHLGAPTHPEMQRVLQQAAATLKSIGVPAGILAGSAEQANQYFDWGYTFVAAGVDTTLLVQAVDGLRANIVTS